MNTELTHLYLQDNEITSMSPLKEISSLQKLFDLVFHFSCCIVVCFSLSLPLSLFLFVTIFTEVALDENFHVFLVGYDFFSLFLETFHRFRYFLCFLFLYVQVSG